jgi:hypothetical protein
MRRLIGVGFRRFSPFDLAYVELLGRVVGGKGKHGAEIAVATYISVDANPIRMDS